MSEWQKIEHLKPDGRQVLFYMPAGIIIAPAVEMREPTRSESVAIYRHSGDWPQAQFRPTHYMELPEPPK